MLDFLACGLILPWQDDDAATHLAVAPKSPAIIEQEEANNVDDVERKREDMTHELIKERYALLGQLRHSKKEMKRLTVERDEARNEIDVLKSERRVIKNALHGQREDRDILDSVFEW
jgi:hypothetical protein